MRRVGPRFAGLAGWQVGGRHQLSWRAVSVESSFIIPLVGEAGGCLTHSIKKRPENIEADVRLREWKDFPKSAIRWTLDRV
jgi:hypothetical protein